MMGEGDRKKEAGRRVVEKDVCLAFYSETIDITCVCEHI